VPPAMQALDTRDDDLAEGRSVAAASTRLEGPASQPQQIRCRACPTGLTAARLERGPPQTSMPSVCHAHDDDDVWAGHRALAQVSLLLSGRVPGEVSHHRLHVGVGQIAVHRPPNELCPSAGSSAGGRRGCRLGELKAGSRPRTGQQAATCIAGLLESLG
jgi:hypothetical protein